ncbi:glutamyl aminopeptidase-like isoform X2 [Neocloeon triangulifer]|uniref:glutamyl aminopeptidase-like isoform X2 n=1 Tax=Neocloeon triangulifer TaxID=2078957 RepID=UPI00286EE024|nr:glutamyl aminopeptidase-like isoform X2 [Neocloeon triangulifer]
MSAPWDTEFRLPKSLSVRHYDLFLHPDIENGTFEGRVRMDLNLGEAQDYLAVHQVGLTVRNAKVEAPGGAKIALKDAFPAPKNEFFVLLPEQENFQPGEVRVYLDFSGSLQHSDIVGFYTSQYKDEQGNFRKIVSSKFEPTYARRAFPCLDEPDKKAHFTISLVKPKDATWKALSNMDENKVEDGPGDNEKTVFFSSSVKMSTYLACFIVSEFDFETENVVNLDTSTFPVSVYGRSDLKSKLIFARDAAKAITEYYIDYFQIGYPLPKLDLIGIPDFVSGAMENWGLITFRETNLLVDEATDAVSNIQQVGSVVAHEIAHMWFGNLVTMKWWDDLWLNEGFASFMEYKSLDFYKKDEDWKLLEQFLVMDLQPVMALDAQLSSHPIIQQVSHPDQINALFDTITYSKGCSVIRMLEGILGEDVFQKGVTKYLNRFIYDNAVTTDLWQSMTEAALEAQQSVDVTRVMNTWTLQMGLPVVEIKYNETTGIATLMQKRFFGSPGAEKKSLEVPKSSPYGYRWDVPLSYIEGSIAGVKTEWFKMEPFTIQIQFDAAKTTWFKFNYKQIGFYRVNYDEKMWGKLIEALKASEIAEDTDRSSLIDDVFSLADGSYVTYKQALDLSEYLENETGYISWSTSASKFLKLLPFMRSRPAYPTFMAFVEKLVKNQYDALKWTEGADDPHITKRLRSTILNLACSCGYQTCLDETTTPFNDWIADETKVPSINVRALVYNFGMEREGNPNGNWDKVWDRYVAAADPQEKLRLLISLTYVKDVTTLRKYLFYAEDDSLVRSQDYFTVLQTMSDNPLGSSLVWDYVRDNWDKLVERFTLNSRSLGRMIPRITQNFDTQDRLDEMKAFFAKYPNAGAGASAREQALERVESNIQWVSLYYGEIESWLNTWATPPAPK